MTNKADKSQKKGLMIMAAACVVMLVLGGPASKALAGTGQMQAGSGAQLTDGEYTSEIAGTGDSAAEKSIVKMTVKNGKIESCNWDIQTADGTMKSKLAVDGQYIMTEDGLLWSEQADLLEDMVIANNGDAVLLTDETGKLADQTSGVSINISQFKAGVEDCISQAGGVSSVSAAETESTAEAK